MKPFSSFRTMPLVFLVLLAASLSLRLHAQHRFGFHFRPGIAFPATQREDVALKTGAGFDIAGSYCFMPHVSLYAGWGWNRFSVKQSFTVGTTDFEETGYIFGLMFQHPMPNDLPFAYFLKGGALYNHIELEDAAGAVIADSGHGFGFQVETGLLFSLSDLWRLTPGIKYQTLTRDLTIAESVHRFDLNYLSVGVTLSKVF